VIVCEPLVFHYTRPAPLPLNIPSAAPIPSIECESLFRPNPLNCLPSPMWLTVHGAPKNHWMTVAGESVNPPQPKRRRKRVAVVGAEGGGKITFSQPFNSPPMWLSVDGAPKNHWMTVAGDSARPPPSTKKKKKKRMGCSVPKLKERRRRMSHTALPAPLFNV